MVTLSDIAVVKTGVVLPRKQAKTQNEVIATYKQLNLKAINSNGSICVDELEEFLANEKLRAEYLTQPKDIIVRLTMPYTAVLIDNSCKGLVIPSHFVVIRAEEEKILPEYLYWLLNTDKIKSMVYKNISSNTIGTIKPSFYANLKIEMLSIEQQRKIGELNLLAKKELYLLERLKEEKMTYYKEAINKVKKEMRKRK